MLATQWTTRAQSREVTAQAWESEMEQEVQPSHPDPSWRAPRTYAALFTRIAVIHGS
jgi:hypothetical protein